MSIFRRCLSSRPLTASGRCVSCNRIHGYVHTLIGEKKKSSEGWFIQSWPSPTAVAIGCTRMTSSGAVEGCQLPEPTRGRSPGRRSLGNAFISQRYCDPYRTPSPHPFTHTPLTFLFLGVQANADPRVVICRCSPPCARSSHYLFATGGASNHVMWARRPRPRSTYRLCSLG